MEQNTMRKLTIKEKQNMGGGWAWLVAALPWLIQLINVTISGISVLNSEKGSLKYNARSNLLDASWDNTKSITANSNTPNIFYGY